MAKDFIPQPLAELLVWAKANSALITANAAGYFLTPTIASPYADLVTDFEEKYTAGKAENAGKIDRIRMYQARKDLVTYARAWARPPAFLTATWKAPRREAWPPMGLSVVETDLVHQHAIGALADLDLALVGVGLALLVERHYHGGRAIAAQQLGLLLEGLHALLH